MRKPLIQAGASWRERATATYVDLSFELLDVRLPQLGSAARVAVANAGVYREFRQHAGGLLREVVHQVHTAINRAWLKP